MVGALLATSTDQLVSVVGVSPTTGTVLEGVRLLLLGMKLLSEYWTLWLSIFLVLTK